MQLLQGQLPSLLILLLLDSDQPPPRCDTIVATANLKELKPFFITHDRLFLRYISWIFGIGAGFDWVSRQLPYVGSRTR